MRFSSRLIAALVVALALVGLRPAVAADDPLSNRQWALTQIHAPSAWSASTGKDIKIGVVDSGVNRNHEDLAGKVIAATTCVGTGGDSANCAGEGDDINGHGTHVAAVAAAATSNGVGIAGVAPDFSESAQRRWIGGGLPRRFVATRCGDPCRRGDLDSRGERHASSYARRNVWIDRSDLDRRCPIPLTRRRMLDAFGRLGDQLAEAGVVADIYIVGGAVMVTEYDARASTSNDDAAAFEPYGEVARAAGRVAESMALRP